MDSSANAFHAVSPYLPESVLQGLASTPVEELALDNLVRLISGAEPSPNSAPDLRDTWSLSQASITTALSPFKRSDNKRPLEDSEPDSTAKRQRTSPSESSIPVLSDGDTGKPVYSLLSVSATAPVRKKVDINIRENAVVFLNSVSKSMDTPAIPLSSLSRAFLLPTRGKTKPHWTIVILSADSQRSAARDRQKAPANEKPQIIFGIDAKLPAVLTTTTYDADGIPSTITHPKNTETFPILREFLGHLPVSVLEPSTDTFKSAVPGLGKSANPDGVPGVEAYRAAKAGSLWFMPEGILWGESRPCEFWAVEDLIGQTEGLRILGGIGKTCSVILTRSLSNAKDSANEVIEAEGDEPSAQETEFSMVDSKEKEAIERWKQQYQHTFGTSGGQVPSVGDPSTTKTETLKSAGPLTIHYLRGETDSSDEDFAASSSDDSAGSTNESSDENSDDDGEGENGDDDNDSDEAAGSNEDESEGELDPKYHPLLRAGRLPRISNAAMEVALGMAVDNTISVDNEEEVDELMD